MSRSDASPHDEHRRATARLAGLATADAVAAEAERIYGSPLRGTGVVHVTAVWQSPVAGAPLVTLRSGDLHALHLHGGDPAAAGTPPRHPYDAFALGLARARADALLTTAEVLRQEPQLRHEPPGPGALPRGLEAWRREALGKTRPPVLFVMTRSGEVDLDHPAFDRAGRSVIYAGRAAGWALESRTADAGVELITVDDPSPRDAVSRLRREFGAATVVVEAGPSVARRLYGAQDLSEELAEDAASGRGAEARGAFGADGLLAALDPLPRVDELLLTVLHRGDLPTRFRGPRFLPRGEVENELGRPVSTHRLRSPESESGDWELARYVRR